MTKSKEYILNEVKIIEKECLEKGISSIEWIERYAEEYRRRSRRNGYGSMRKTAYLKTRRG